MRGTEQKTEKPPIRRTAVGAEHSRKEPEKSGRAIALSILMDIFEDGRFSHLALRETLAKETALPEKERALITRIVEGTTELSIQLDYILNRYSKIKVRKMKPLIRNILRMSAYQILYLDRIPDSAAINEAVKLIKKRGLQGLAGFGNAVLRSISREKEAIVALLQSEETPAYIRYSLPEWLYNYMKLNFGEEETVRISQYFLSDDNSIYVRYRDGRSAVVHGNVAHQADFKRGEMTVQDYASQQVGIWAAPKKGDYVVDICSAPGGKACHVAELLQGSGHVDARDVSRDKVNMILENVRRLHLHNVSVKIWDGRIQDASLLRNGEGIADIVLCDVPCSGLGIIGKKPDIRFSASLEGIQSLQKLQREILTVAVRYVKPGGRLIYSTCTITREEDEQNVHFLTEEMGLRLLREQRFLPGQPSDGFYIAELVKEQNGKSERL